jgi:hypothetical protein
MPRGENAADHRMRSPQQSKSGSSELPAHPSRPVEFRSHYSWSGHYTGIFFQVVPHVILNIVRVIEHVAKAGRAEQYPIGNERCDDRFVNATIPIDTLGSRQPGSTAYLFVLGIGKLGATFFRSMRRRRFNNGIAKRLASAAAHESQTAKSSGALDAKPFQNFEKTNPITILPFRGTLKLPTAPLPDGNLNLSYRR